MGDACTAAKSLAKIPISVRDQLGASLGASLYEMIDFHHVGHMIWCLTPGVSNSILVLLSCSSRLERRSRNRKQTDHRFQHHRISESQTGLSVTNNENPPPSKLTPVTHRNGPVRPSKSYVPSPPFCPPVAAQHDCAVHDPPFSASARPSASAPLQRSAPHR